MAALATVKVRFININGIGKVEEGKGKEKLMELLLEMEKDKADILCIQESKGSSEHEVGWEGVMKEATLLTGQSYTAHYKHRKKKQRGRGKTRGGGLAIIARAKVGEIKIRETEREEIMSATIENEAWEGKLYINNIYIPPIQSKYCPSEDGVEIIMNEGKRIQEEMENKDVLIEGGDFNMHSNTLTPNNYYNVMEYDDIEDFLRGDEEQRAERKSSESDKKADKRAKTIITAMEDREMFLMNGTNDNNSGFTHHRGGEGISVLDYIFVERKHFSNCEMMIRENILSDHHFIDATMTMETNQAEKEVEEKQREMWKFPRGETERKERGEAFQEALRERKGKVTIAMKELTRVLEKETVQKEGACTEETTETEEQKKGRHEARARAINQTYNIIIESMKGAADEAYEKRRIGGSNYRQSKAMTAELREMRRKKRRLEKKYKKIRIRWVRAKQRTRINRSNNREAYRQDNTSELKGVLDRYASKKKEAEKEYKKEVERLIEQRKLEEVEKMDSTFTSNPRKVWKKLREMAGMSKRGRKGIRKVRDKRGAMIEGEREILEAVASYFEELGKQAATTPEEEEGKEERQGERKRTEKKNQKGKQRQGKKKKKQSREEIERTEEKKRQKERERKWLKEKEKDVEREKERIENNNNREVNESEVSRAVARTKTGKAPGPDGIPNILIKEGGETINRWLAEFFSLSLQYTIIPEAWRYGMVTLLHKGGSELDLDNYRGIALTDTVSKVFTNILRERVETVVDTKLGQGWESEQEYKEDHEIAYTLREKRLTENQAGFRRGRNTSDQLVMLKEVIEQNNDAGKDVFTCFLDIRKAYDTVNRRTLMEALKWYNINGQLLHIIECLYERVGNTVRIGKQQSRRFESERGVRQGCNLSPLLFDIYLNIVSFDLFYQQKETDKCSIKMWTKVGREENGSPQLGTKDRRINHLMYADDMVLMATTEERLQEWVGVAEKWARILGFTFNVKKCKVMCFTSKQTRRHMRKVVMGEGKVLEQVSAFKYLGVWFGEFRRSRWKRQKEEVLKKIKRLKWQVRRLRLAEGYLSIKIGRILFFTLVRPVFEYASFVWWKGGEKWNEGEIAARGFLKEVLKLKKSASSALIYGELGTMDMKTRRDLLFLCWSQRVMLMHPSMWIRQVWVAAMNRVERESRERESQEREQKQRDRQEEKEGEDDVSERESERSIERGGREDNEDRNEAGRGRERAVGPVTSSLRWVAYWKAEIIRGWGIEKRWKGWRKRFLEKEGILETFQLQGERDVDELDFDLVMDEFQELQLLEAGKSAWFACLRQAAFGFFRRKWKKEYCNLDSRGGQWYRKFKWEWMHAAEDYLGYNADWRSTQMQCMLRYDAWAGSMKNQHQWGRRREGEQEAVVEQHCLSCAADGMGELRDDANHAINVCGMFSEARSRLRLQLEEISLAGVVRRIKEMRIGGKNSLEDVILASGRDRKGRSWCRDPKVRDRFYAVTRQFLSSVRRCKERWMRREGIAI